MYPKVAYTEMSDTYRKLKCKQEPYRAACSECGEQCVLPWKPDAGKPTLCRRCALRRGITY